MRTAVRSTAEVLDENDEHEHADQHVEQQQQREDHRQAGRDHEARDRDRVLEHQEAEQLRGGVRPQHHQQERDQHAADRDRQRRQRQRGLGADVDRRSAMNAKQHSTIASRIAARRRRSPTAPARRRPGGAARTRIPSGNSSALSAIVTAPSTYSELPPWPVAAVANASAATTADPSAYSRSCSHTSWERSIPNSSSSTSTAAIVAAAPKTRQLQVAVGRARTGR